MVRSRFGRKQKLVLGVALVVAVVVVLVPLHAAGGLNTGRQATLYRETVQLFRQQVQYAVDHQGGYAPTALELATINRRLAFVANADTNPVTQFAVNVTTRGYFMQLADQSLGGTVNFSVLVPDAGPAILTCAGPGPLCHSGVFHLPASVPAVLAAAQERLYRQAVAVIRDARRVARANGGQFAPVAGDLAVADPALDFLLSPSSPVSQFWLDTSGRAFEVTLSGVSTQGYASFTAFFPNSGKPALTCTGAAPLCDHGTFTLQR